MDYLPIQELANRWNISKRRIQILCKEGRIDGAKMIGNMWVVPSDAKRPRDARVKNPVISKHDEISGVRKELKRMPKELFKIAEYCNINEQDKRSVVLSSIAYALCILYLDEEKKPSSIFAAIYKDISGKCEEIEPNLKMMEIVCQFIDNAILF